MLDFHHGKPAVRSTISSGPLSFLGSPPVWATAGVNCRLWSGARGYVQQTFQPVQTNGMQSKVLTQISSGPLFTVKKKNQTNKQTKQKQKNTKKKKKHQMNKTVSDTAFGRVVQNGAGVVRQKDRSSTFVLQSDYKVLVDGLCGLNFAGLGLAGLGLAGLGLAGLGLAGLGLAGLGLAGLGLAGLGLAGLGLAGLGLAGLGLAGLGLAGLGLAGLGLAGLGLAGCWVARDWLAGSWTTLDFSDWDEDVEKMAVQVVLQLVLAGAVLALRQIHNHLLKTVITNLQPLFYHDGIDRYTSAGLGKEV